MLENFKENEKYDKEKITMYALHTFVNINLL